MKSLKSAILSLVCICLTTLSFGQSTESVAVIPNDQYDINKLVKVPVGSKLIESFRIESPGGLHLTYDQFINDKKILNAGAKLHVKSNGSYIIQEFMVDLPVIKENKLDYWLVTENGLEPVKEVISDQVLYPVRQYMDENDKILLEQDIHKFVRKDTTLFSKVFKVNPINSANTVYGGDYADNGDQSNAALEAEMSWVSNQVKFNNDTFIFESEFLKFKDISSPFGSTLLVFNDSVSTDRANDDFEYLNVYYHVNEMGEYINGHGHDAITQQLDVDVHGYGGADNSAYDPVNHTLQFGDGGVDDAEDGEVVIHEFVHSLSEKASPNNTIGKQREAMEEGACDYFAKSYSRTYNDNTPNLVFSWDGHNEYWDGFEVNTDRKYPQDLIGGKDADRDMWSSALMCMHDAIGREAADSLILEHFYFQLANATMPQMAQIILDIDSTDFNKRYYYDVKGCFVEAGFMDWSVSITPTSLSPFKVINQSGFVTGDGNLIIEFPNKVKYKIYDALGKLLIEQSNNNIELSPSSFVKGFYVIQIEIAGQFYSQRFVR